MSELPACPHCGLDAEVYRNVRVSGYTKEIFSEIGYGGDMPNHDQLKGDYILDNSFPSSGKLKVWTGGIHPERRGLLQLLGLGVELC